jgi:hypothetical protein
MSERAMFAYESGEKPKSKWTKSAMIAEIKHCCWEWDIEFNPDVIKGMTKDDLFREFFAWSSWHHTGKFARETDFYAVDETWVKDAFTERE